MVKYGRVIKDSYNRTKKIESRDLLNVSTMKEGTKLAGVREEDMTKGSQMIYCGIPLKEKPKENKQNN